MGATFDDQLAKIRGKIRRINMGNYFQRKRSGLNYYANKADELHRSALIIWDSDQRLRDVFALLAGLSIELLLKGILMGLQEQSPLHHRLADLCDQAGIAIDQDDRIILQAMSEHVYWASKYPAPKNGAEMAKALALFDKQRRRSGNLARLYIEERDINRENYERLWAMFLQHFWRVHSAVFESAE